MTSAPAAFFIHDQPAQIGRAMKKLGIQLIPGYSPQARGGLGHAS
jgi:hypothetical protein